MARMHEARETSAPRRPRAAAVKAKAAGSDAQPRVLQDYQNALQFMQDNKLDKARALFDKVLRDAPPELVERVRIYQSVCERRSTRSSLSFATPEEQYDYAISLLNAGSFEDAREQFDAILAAHPDSDFAHYGAALLNSMTGQNEEALEHLTRAIGLNPALRIQARTDPDFIDMVDDPRFTELLYPEVP
ncbi:MAG TPA: tetratricopeptide repeat protein [Acidobacteriaceae bacterium]|nr:tetratricopeptide repeat protein [Acidobacteriaceae bacterium]